ncbi:hypothetical protein BH23CHL7_BH23CHL7_19450 [soil metagenome]
MDETHSPMLDGLDFDGRLDEVERRLASAAADPLPDGRTDPDPDTPEERWQAPQVWAHMAEFIAYWHAQFESVVGEYAGEPVPFGRTKRDPGRLTAIEIGSGEPVAQLMSRVRASLAGFRRYLAGFGAAEWNAVGLHQTLGSMDMERMVERFVVNHLEEHLDQLDRLRAEDG